MNVEEVRTVLRAVASLCPAQKFDEFTPDMWLAILADTSFADAKTAVITLGRTQAFISPGEIHTEVKRIRSERIRRLPQPCPNDVPGVSERDELRAITRAMADGVISTIAEVYAYERWGGSMHLALETGQLPALDGPAPEQRGPILPAGPRRRGHPLALEAALKQVTRE